MYTKNKEEESFCPIVVHQGHLFLSLLPSRRFHSSPFAPFLIIEGCLTSMHSSISQSFPRQYATLPVSA